MLLKGLTLLLIALTIEAKIRIDITVASRLDEAKVSFSGVDNKVITDQEIALFNFTKPNLNKGLRVELGRIPEDVFWKDPTPYDNLFEEYEWPQVIRNTRIQSAKILAIVNEKVLIRFRDYVNNTTSPFRTKVNGVELLEYSVTSSWFEGGVPEDDIIYDVYLNFDKIKFKYQDKWRNASFINTAVPFGNPNAGYGNKNVIIKPGHTIMSKLTGLRTIMLIEIEYLTKLIGNVIADYENLYGKYHFYSPTVANIMKAAKMNNEVRNKHWIEVRCYTEPKLEVFDKDTGDYFHFSELNNFHHAKTKKNIFV